MHILPANILHSWVPIREVSSKHPHKSIVRDRVTPSLVINLHSPLHWRGWHIIISSFIMWWRRGLLSSINIIFFIIFNEDELRLFFRLGPWLGTDWRLDRASGACSYSWGASSCGSSGTSKTRGG
jgi:hypothetical protein